MNINRLKVNQNTNNCDNDLKIRFRNENDLIFRNPNRKQVLIGGRRTPSPPKSQVLSSNQYLQQLNTSSVKPMIKIQSSLTKSCYTGLHLNSDQRIAQRLPTATPLDSQKTPDCDRKLKKLEESGLLAKFAKFQITKSIPLALEEEDEEENDSEDDHNLNDEVFIDISKTQETIELKSSEEFEPKFVSQIKDEIRKISSNSFGSQSCEKNRGKRSSGDDSIKRKSSNGSRSQSTTSVVSKWQQKLTQISAKTSNNSQLSSRRSKSNDNLNNNRENKKEVINRQKSGNNLDNKSKERRSHSSNGRLSSSSLDKQNDNKTKNDSLSRRSRSQSNVEQKSNNNNESKNSCNSSLADNSNSNRDKTIRKIKVNNKYYQILNCIGQGGSSRVYQVYDPELQMTLAIKVVDLSRADTQTVCGYKNEITLLSKLRECKRVVRMYDYEYQNNGQQLLVVMEKGDSDLSNVLKSFIESEEKRSLDSHLIRFYWQQMLKAVDEIHSYTVVHSDLKPVNFILVAGKLKLIDFGIANAIQSNYTSVYKESQIGTINYMAPEALHNRSDVKGKTVVKYNCKADVWSLGCILYTLVYGRTPFHHFNNVYQKAAAIMDPNHQINYPPIDDLLLLDVMQKCLQRDPHKRPTTSELLNHSYLTEAKSSKASALSQNALISQINNLTPNRIKQLSQVIEKLAKK